MQYGKWNGPEGRGASQPPRFRNFTFRDLLSEGSFVVGNISGLPDSPVTDVTFENVAARNNHRGIQCMYAENVRILHGVKGHSCHSTHPDVVDLDQLDPLPRGGKKAREDLINSVFGHRTLPSRSQPDQQQKIQEDLYELTWVFHVPRLGSRSAVLWHQGHHDCICPMFPAQPSPPGSKIPPGFQQGACAPGCMGYKHIKDHQLRRHATWWDLDNVTSFFRSLGHHVFILSMPLVGVNFELQRSSNWTDHWWFQRQEALGDFTIRYFCEPVILTMNYALSLGLQDIHLAGLSGGAWTASIIAAMDQRVRTSIQVAGVLPYSMQSPLTSIPAVTLAVIWVISSSSATCHRTPSAREPGILATAGARTLAEHTAKFATTDVSFCWVPWKRIDEFCSCTMKTTAAATPPPTGIPSFVAMRTKSGENFKSTRSTAGSPQWSRITGNTN